MTRRSSSPYTAEQLAASFRYQGLVSAKALGPDQLEATFKDEATARSSADPVNTVFDLGPYRIDSVTPGRVRLRRRGEHLHRRHRDRRDGRRPTSGESSWRASWTSCRRRPTCTGSSSPGWAAFACSTFRRRSRRRSTSMFETRAWRMKRVRRRIASGLNRQAIARIAGGDATSAAPQVTGGSEDVAVAVQTLAAAGAGRVHDGARRPACSAMSSIGWVSRSMCEPREPRASRGRDGRQSIPAAAAAPAQRTASLRALSYDPTRHSPADRIRRTRSTTPPSAASDLAKAQEILDRELPATVLFESRAFAAIDARFCGDVTPSPISWRWMADLHLCDSDKGEGKSTP